MLLCLFTAVFAAIGLTSNARLASMATMALAPTGLSFAFLDLWTGCLWNKAVWGDWWQADPGTFSALALALFYLGFIILHTAIEDLERANKACALLLVAGAFSILVDFASAQSWGAQHQGMPPGITGAIRLNTVELASLLAMGLAFMTYAGAAALLRLRCVILEAECERKWLATQHARRST
jgi:heme exporter protein C